ncbi:MAG: hypothetical protein KC501_02125 [Myxococcales bacterium]|nr:hypothetical protein [Myxococcales bacterium]
MPLRPIVFALGLLLCLAGVVTCATAPSHVEFPTWSDGLIIGGLVLLVLGAAGRAPRGRQLLGRDASPRRAEASPPSPPDE